MAHRYDDCRFYDVIKDRQAEIASVTGNKPSFTEVLSDLFPDAALCLVAPAGSGTNPPVDVPDPPKPLQA